jgi:hypothetical protein
MELGQLLDIFMQDLLTFSSYFWWRTAMPDDIFCGPLQNISKSCSKSRRQRPTVSAMQMSDSI